MRLDRRVTKHYHCPCSEQARQVLLDHGIPSEDHRLASPQKADRFRPPPWRVHHTPGAGDGERIGGASDLARRLGVDAPPGSLLDHPAMAAMGLARLLPGW